MNQKKENTNIKNIGLYIVASFATLVFGSSILLLFFIYIIDDYGYAIQANQFLQEYEEKNNGEKEAVSIKNTSYMNIENRGFGGIPIILINDKTKKLLDNKLAVYNTIKFHPGVYLQPQQKITVETMHTATENSIKTHKIKGLNYKSDHAKYRFLSEQQGFYNKHYIPSDLVEITPSALVEIAINQNSPILIRQEAHEALIEMASAYYAIFNKPLKVTSGRRSYGDQVRIHQHCLTPRLCATPGHSEHQTGFAIDFQDMHGKTLLWMQNNAHKYGFHQSYQENSIYRDYEKEDWHWRYVGKDLASFLFKENISLIDRYYTAFQ